MISNEVFINNVRYVSVRVAARNVKLSANYLTKLCRSGLSASITTEGGWYVHEPSLREHLDTKKHARAIALHDLAEKRRQELLDSTLWNRFLCPSVSSIIHIAPVELHAHRARENQRARKVKVARHSALVLLMMIFATGFSLVSTQSNSTLPNTQFATVNVSNYSLVVSIHLIRELFCSHSHLCSPNESQLINATGSFSDTHHTADNTHADAGSNVSSEISRATNKVISNSEINIHSRDTYKINQTHLNSTKYNDEEYALLNIYTENAYRFIDDLFAKDIFANNVAI